MIELDKVKEIFLSEVDEETKQENLVKIKEWEETLIKNKAISNWQENEITVDLVKNIKSFYKEISLSLLENRQLTDEQRKSLWARQDACLWILSLMTKNITEEVETIKREIEIAINVTK